MSELLWLCVTTQRPRCAEPCQARAEYPSAGARPPEMGARPKDEQTQAGVSCQVGGGGGYLARVRYNDCNLWDCNTCFRWDYTNDEEATCANPGLDASTGIISLGATQAT